MARLTVTQMYALARKAGFGVGGAVNAAAIAEAESGGNPDAVNQSSGATGLWQILPSAHPQYAGTDLKDPGVNAKAAYEISNHGRNWSPWVTYTSGTYRQYLPQAQSAADKETGSGISINDLLGGLGSVITQPVKGIEEIGAVLKAVYTTVTDGKMWRSLGWLLLGIIVLLFGVWLWVRKELSGGNLGGFAAYLRGA